MRNRQRNINKKISTAGSTMLLAVVFILCTLSLNSCFQNSAEELSQFEAEQERSSFSAFDLHTFVTDSGFYKYEFESSELHQFDNLEEPYVDFPHGLKFKSFDNRGTTLKTQIRCNNAKYYKQKNLWELNNDVQAVNEKGNLLNTEQLFWNADEKQIYTDRFVKITTETQTITGIGLVSDDALTKYEIKRPGGEIEIEDTKKEPQQ